MKEKIVATILVLFLMGSFSLTGNVIFAQDALGQNPQDGSIPQLSTPTPITNQLIVTINGQALPLSYVEVFRNDRSLGLAYTDESGKFSMITYLEETSTGINSFRARLYFFDAPPGEFSPTLYITFDLVPPQAPVPESTSVIMEPTQFLFGSAEPGSLVFVLVDGFLLKDVMTDASGQFSTGSLNLSSGWHNILFYAQDLAGNQSIYSPMVVAYVQEIPSPFKEALDNLAQMGVIRGYPDGTMRPLSPVTRAEFAVFLARLLNTVNYIPPTSTASSISFTDLPSGHWAQEAVAFISAQGLMKGFPDGTFRPDEYVQGKEVIAALVRTAGLEREAQAAQALLKDAPWYAGYSVVGAQHGLLYPDFAPEEDALRGEVAVSLACLSQIFLPGETR